MKNANKLKKLGIRDEELGMRNKQMQNVQVYHLL